MGQNKKVDSVPTTPTTAKIGTALGKTGAVAVTAGARAKDAVEIGVLKSAVAADEVMQAAGTAYAQGVQDFNVGRKPTLDRIDALKAEVKARRAARKARKSSR